MKRMLAKVRSKVSFFKEKSTAVPASNERKSEESAVPAAQQSALLKETENIAEPLRCWDIHLNIAVSLEHVRLLGLVSMKLHVNKTAIAPAFHLWGL